MNFDEAEEEGLNLFERERTQMEIRILGIAIYIQTSSTRRTAKIFSEFHPVSHTAIWKRIKKVERLKRNCLLLRRKRIGILKNRNLVAIDETVVKANKKRYFVYSAVDIERNELILMKVYTTRNWLVTKSFIKEVLKYCDNKPKFVIDKAPWLIQALKSLRLEYEHEGFREKKLG